MRFTTKAVFLCFLMFASTSLRLSAQTNELVNLLRDFEAKAAAGTPRTYDDAEPVLERFEQTDKDSVIEALPAILQGTTKPYMSVRRVCAMALFEIAIRPEGQALISSQTGTLAALLVDPDIPIRRITGMTLDALRLNQTSPLLPNLKAYLSREDAVSTIGAGVAGLLMKAAPEDAASNSAIVRYMQRKDQTPASRADVLQSVRVAKSHNREIGKAVATYADDSNEHTEIQAIETLEAMGKSVLIDNQQLLSGIASDSRRYPSVRAAASKALAAIP